MNFIRLYSTWTIFTCVCSVAFADRPPEPPSVLRQISTHVCAGTVVARNPSVSRKSNWETTDYLVEIVVTSVLKGKEIGLMERIQVDSQLRKWIGRDDKMPTGWNGVGAPMLNAQVLVYLTGDKATGFKFAEPNGYTNIQKLRNDPTQIQAYMSDQEWETVAQNIGRVAPVKATDSTGRLALIGLLVLVCLATSLLLKKFTYSQRAAGTERAG